MILFDHHFDALTHKLRSFSIINCVPFRLTKTHYINAGMHEEACRILRVVDYDYLFWWGNYPQLIALQAKIAGHLKAPDLRIYNFESAGRAYRALGHIVKAIEFYELALVAAQESHNLWEEGDQLSNLGISYHLLGLVNLSLQYYQRAANIAQEMQVYQRNEDFWVGGVGLAYLDLGRFEEAVRFIKKALAIARMIGHRRGEVIHLGRLGLAFRALGDTRQAVHFLNTALSIAREVNHRRQEGFLLGRLGAICLQKRHFREAYQIYNSALAFFDEEFSDKETESGLLLDLGITQLFIGNVSQAYECCQKACQLALPKDLYLAQLALGVSLLYRDDKEAARVFADTIACCQSALEKTGDLYKARYTMATALVGQAVCNTYWFNTDGRSSLLALPLEEYRRAMNIVSAPGVVCDALRDLELIRAAGIEGLELVFELLEGVLNANTPSIEDSTDLITV